MELLKSDNIPTNMYKLKLIQSADLQNKNLGNELEEIDYLWTES